MLIGSGLIAGAFRDFEARDDCTIFAAGVASSGETAPAAFARETDRLRAALVETPGVLVYFGTCSQFDPMMRDTPYVRHKAAMEHLIAQSGRDWRVFRLPQVVGPSRSPNTLVNYFARHLREQTPFEVWLYTARALIAVEHVALVARHLLALDGPMNRATNFWTRTVTPLDIVKELEAILGVKGRYTVTDRGVPFDVEADEFHGACADVGLKIDAGYTARVLRGPHG